MIKLLGIKLLPGSSSFSVAHLDKDGLAWIVFGDNLMRKHYKFWSEKSASGSVAPDDVVSEIAARLHGIEANTPEFREAVLFSMTGWDYWGLGRPEPIADFLEYEFASAAVDFRAD